MTDAKEIEEIVRRTLENLTTPMTAGRRQWTRDVKTALGAAGRAHGYWVCAGGLPRDSAAADSGECSTICVGSATSRTATSS